MSPALYRAWRKGARTLLQMAAAGGLTALVDLVAHGLSPATAGAVLVVWGVVVAFLHNYTETAGILPVLLPTPGLVPSVAPLAVKAVGTIETTIDHVGEVVGDVTGTVTDLTGGLLGEVTPPGEGDTA